jgi:nitroreductase
MMRELVTKNRSYRRFREGRTIDEATLRELVDLARLSASGANRQPLKYILSCDGEKNALIFPHLTWAGYLKDWAGPVEGERPAAYIVILSDNATPGVGGCDHGIAAQSMLLSAVEQGLGGCMLGALDRAGLKQSLKIDEQYEILLVVALGEPCETVVIDELQSVDDIKYWRDAEGVHHVPKRRLDDLIVE